MDYPRGLGLETHNQMLLGQESSLLGFEPLTPPYSNGF